MRIAQIAPLAESVPPKLYGGTERVVHYLTEELVRQGHEVTLFASGDSRTSARLIAPVPRALRLDSQVRDALPYVLLQMEQVRRRAWEFDVLHFHVDLVHFPVFRELRRRTVTTLHGRLDLPDLAPFYAVFADMPLVAISRDQRSYLRDVYWAGTVHHGLPVSALPFTARPKGDYLAFIGRISPEKRPDRAIAIARRAGMPLRIAAKVDAVDRDYFQRLIEPLLAAPHVEFVGEIGEAEKADFLGNARALLFPVDWPEPFGLVAIEAMACGTPVIGWRCGAVPEIVEDGVTGFVVDSELGAARAVARIGELDRRKVRRRFEERFSVERMAQDYLDIYRSLPERAAALARAA
ncbi:MAG TPA: glycosyltransferase family 4 protein [Burkholderiales bacterium]|nr:glycosyltransferase family 4 protein [Burkholderiales bacterium]